MAGDLLGEAGFGEMTSEPSGESQPVLIGDYEAVRAALRNPDLKTTGNAVECGQRRPLLPLQAEGSYHRRVRGRLDALIGRHSPLPLEAIVRDHAVALISGLDVGVPVDLRDRYSCRLAARVLGSLLGLTDPEVVRVRELSEVIMGQHRLVGSVPAPPRHRRHRVRVPGPGGQACSWRRACSFAAGPDQR